MHRTGFLPVFISLLLAIPAAASAQPSATEAGLMQGFPPPPDKQVLRSNFRQPPYSRWAFQHMRELLPTREIWRGDGPVSELPEGLLDIGGFRAPVRAGRVVSLDELVDEAHTDAIVILHRGRIVYERYLNGQQPHTQHQMFSATKSFVGTLMLMLIEEGKVDPAQTVAHYVPELAESGFGDATVQQVLDMTTAVAYTEIYDDPDSDIWRYGWVFGSSTPPADYDGPLSIYAYLPTLKKVPGDQHGHAFHYVTPNTDVLGWIVRRASGKSVDQNIAERILQPLGAERDAYMWLDGYGTEMAGGGLNITARDAARFGQMILQRGEFNGRRILPAAVTARILDTKGDPDVFTRFYRTQPGNEWYGDVGFGYHDQWWTFNNAHKAVSAIGVYGQYIYLDPVAQMVVVKQSSSPDAEGGANLWNDTDGPLLYQALAEHLMKRS